MNPSDRAFVRVILALLAIVLLIGALFAEPALATAAQHLRTLGWQSQGASPG